MGEKQKIERTAEQRALSLIGMCKKSGRLISGVPLVCDAIREGRVYLAVYAGKASENSVKRVCDKAKSFEAEALCLNVTAEELAHAVGKTGAVAAVGICDAGFAGALTKILNGGSTVL